MPGAARGPAASKRGAIEIRRATVDDLDTVVALRIALLREYADHPIYGRLRDDAAVRARPVFRAQIESSEQAIFLAARIGEVAGIMRCAETRGSPLLFPERYCYVTSVYVKPAHRRHGLLSALVGAAEEWAAGRGLTEMRLHNSTLNGSARTAWSQLGFEVNEEVRLKQIRR